VSDQNVNIAEQLRLLEEKLRADSLTRYKFFLTTILSGLAVSLAILGAIVNMSYVMGGAAERIRVYSDATNKLVSQVEVIASRLSKLEGRLEGK